MIDRPESHNVVKLPASTEFSDSTIHSPASSRTRRRFAQIALPLFVAALFLLAWDAGVRISGSDVFPRPIEVLRGIVQLIQKGLLLKYMVASLFRVTWGFTLAVLIGVPFGLFLGWHTWAFQAFNPMIQML